MGRFSAAFRVAGGLSRSPTGKLLEGYRLYASLSTPSTPSQATGAADLVAFGPSRHRAWIRGHWMLLKAMGPSWSGGEQKAREYPILDHSRHVGSMPQVVPNVCVWGSRVTPFGGLWEGVLKHLGGRFGDIIKMGVVCDRIHHLQLTLTKSGGQIHPKSTPN